MRRKRVLVADDDAHVRQALRTRLTQWGYEVVESSDGLGVLSQTTPCHVDALVLDHEMPLGDGRDVARMLRKETAAPIIFLSGHDREEFRDVVTSLADAFFLSKPFDASHLKQLLGSCLDGCDCPTMND